KSVTPTIRKPNQPNWDQLIMKSTKQPNPRRQNGLFRGAL
ncbi:MAG: hypothetical protein ACI9FZ_001397, partial [Bacteroidia bacterium]